MADTVVKRKFWHVLDASGETKEQVLLETSADQVTLATVTSLTADNVQAAIAELAQKIISAGSVDDVQLKLTSGDFKSILKNKVAKFDVVSSGSGDAISDVTVTIDSDNIGHVTLNKNFVRPGIVANASGSTGAFVTGVSAVYDASSNTYNVSYTKGNIALDSTATATNNYISNISIAADGKTITYGASALPTLSVSGGEVESGKYISAIAVNEHNITVTKATLPTESDIQIVGNDGTGNTITGMVASGHTITVTKGSMATSAELEAVDDRLAAVEEVIPSEASSSNQLADKAFVNSSITTATATFRGTYDVKDDLGLSYGASNAAIATALKNKIGTVADNNDYAFAVDKESDNTVYKKFKATGDGAAAVWSYEYSLNNSSFTATQWAAINSGATTTNIGQIETNKTNIATNTSNIATNTSAIAAINSSAVMTSGITADKVAQIATNAGDIADLESSKADKADTVTSVSYSDATLKQTKNGSTTNVVTAAQLKADMGLSTVATSGSYDDLTDKPTINNIELGDVTIAQGSNVSVTTNGSTITVAGAYSEATTSAAGLMSAADKAKLSEIAAGAQVNVIENVATSGKVTSTVTIDSSKVANINVTAVTDAGKWTTARTIGVAVNSGKNAAGADISGTGSQSIDGSTDKTISVELGNSGVTANTANSAYSAVVVNNKGIVTMGGSMVAWGTAEHPSTVPADLMAGGLFFEYVGEAE